MAIGTPRADGSIEAIFMADNKTEKCAHPSCNCMAAKDSKYCGALCEGNAGKPDIICGCGHAACEATARAGSGSSYAGD
ncbi:MAG TPA: hypothetical protein VHZ74_05360 [Bryobacteraceae bacterium]|nr:hypothetical protein [Bryobacteraceae bacterium]